MYRLIIIRFNYLSAKCLFPIILNWQETLMAKYEIEIMNKIISELQDSLGITKVQICHNKVGYYPELQNEFDEAIGNIDYNTEVSQIKILPVDHKIFKSITDEDEFNGRVENFILNRMSFPVRVIDHDQFILETMGNLPLLIIEER